MEVSPTFDSSSPYFAKQIFQNPAKFQHSAVSATFCFFLKRQNIAFKRIAFPWKSPTI